MFLHPFSRDFPFFSLEKMIERLSKIFREGHTSMLFLSCTYEVSSFASSEYFSKKHKKYESVAANFAAKEAFSKALGTGMRGFSFADIEVLRDDFGKPYVNVYGGAKEKCDKEKISGIHISLSHTDSTAMAYVVLEKENL